MNTPLERFFNSIENIVLDSDDNEFDVISNSLLSNTEIDLSSIPFLSNLTYSSTQSNKTNKNNKELVRYRCMVQDIFDAEYYVGKYEYEDENGLKHCKRSHFIDSIEEPTGGKVYTDTSECRTYERLPVYCIPIPGENDWVKEWHRLDNDNDNNNSNGSNNNAVNKRGYDNNNNTTASSSSSSGSSKRHKSIEEINTSSSSSSSSSTNTNTTNNNANNNSIEPQHHPSNIDDASCCLVKFYGNTAKKLKLNDMVEIVGILGTSEEDVMVTSETKSTYDLLGDFDAMDLHAESHLPSSKVLPRLHALVVKKLSSTSPLYIATDTNNTNDKKQQQKVSGSDDKIIWEEYSANQSIFKGYDSKTLGTQQLLQNTLGNSICKLRQVILDSISNLLKNHFDHTTQIAYDTVAEYILLSSLSRIYDRSPALEDAGGPLGAFSVNIIGCDPSSQLPQALQDFFSEISPRCVSIRLDIEALNSERFIARKDYDRNRIQPSALQVGGGTIIIFDETSMHEGQLTTGGVRSLQTAQELVRSQQIPVEFDYFSMKMPVDAASIVLSSAPSVLGTEPMAGNLLSLHLPSFPIGKDSSSNNNNDNKSDKISIPSEHKEAIRKYWSLCKYAPMGMSQEMGSKAVDIFVEARKQSQQQQQSEEDFHIWLKLARLVALSKGEYNITDEHIRYAIELEKQRMNLMNFTSKNSYRKPLSNIANTEKLVQGNN